jgi:hypothetical protein
MIRNMAKKGALGAAGLGAAAGAAYLGGKAYNAAKDMFSGNPADAGGSAGGSAGGVDQQPDPNNSGDAGGAGAGNTASAAPDNSEIFAKLDQLFSELGDDDDPEIAALRQEYQTFKSQNSRAGKLGKNIRAGAQSIGNTFSDFIGGISGQFEENVELNSVLRNAGLAHK